MICNLSDLRARRSRDCKKCLYIFNTPNFRATCFGVNICDIYFCQWCKIASNIDLWPSFLTCFSKGKLMMSPCHLYNESQDLRRMRDLMSSWVTVDFAVKQLFSELVLFRYSLSYIRCTHSTVLKNIEIKLTRTSVRCLIDC